MQPKHWGRVERLQFCREWTQNDCTLVTRQSREKYKDLDVLQKPQKTTDRPIPTTEKILEKYKEEYGEFQVRMNPLISKHLPVTPCCSCRRLQPKHALSDIKRIKKPTFNSTYCTTIHSIQF